MYEVPDSTAWARIAGQSMLPSPTGAKRTTPFQNLCQASMSPDARAVAGISDGLLRLSVGIEHADDLVADIAAALQRAQDAAGCKRTAAR